MLANFYLYDGDTKDLATNENYLNFKWNNGDVLISVTRKGNAASCHLWSDRRGAKELRNAINDWCEFCFWLFDWCEMIIGVINKKGLIPIAKDCGFQHIKTINDNHVYARPR